MSSAITEPVKVSTELAGLMTEHGVEYEVDKTTKTTQTVRIDADVADLVVEIARDREDVRKDSGKYRTDLKNVTAAAKNLIDSAQDVAAFDIEQHALGKILPPMTDEEYAGLVESMEEQGYLPNEPVVIYEGQALDGWHRLKAAEQLGLTPDFTDYKGEDPAGFVFSKNLPRRHLTDDQRAGAAEKLADAGVGKRGEDSDGTTIEQAAAQMKASAHKVKRARAVASAAPAVADGVRSGEITLSQAERIVADPELVESLSDYEGPVADFVPKVPKKVAPKPTGPKLGPGVDQYGNDSAEWKLVTLNDVIESLNHEPSPHLHQSVYICVGEAPPEARETDVIFGELYGAFPVDDRKAAAVRKAVKELSDEDRHAVYNDLLMENEQVGSDADIRKVAATKLIEMFETWDNQEDDEADEED